MLKHIADLSGDYEYFIGWAGQSTSRPWGSKSEAYNLFGELKPQATGRTLGEVKVTTTSGTVTVDVSSATGGTGTSTTVGTYSLEDSSASWTMNQWAGQTVETGGTKAVVTSNTPEVLNLAGWTNIATGAPAGPPGTGDYSICDMAANEWVDAHIRLGTTTTAKVGYGRIVANTAASLTIQWDTVGAPEASTTEAGIITYEDYRFAYKPQVRILVPYQPTTDDTTLRRVPYPSTLGRADQGGRSVTLGPGFTTPAGLTFERSAVLLPFTFNEGIDSFGQFEGDGLATAATSTPNNTLTVTGTPLLDNYYVNGYLRVDWETGGNAKVSYGRIESNTNNTFTITSWLGDGEPTGTPGQWRWTAWVPHYNNNPWSYDAGEGYTYPNNDMHPCAFSTNGAAIRNRPRNITGSAYGDRFGDLLIVAQRMSMATGKRINVVHLGINAAGLAPVNVINTFGFDGILGWYDHRNAGAWAQSLGGEGIFQRLDTLLRYSLPNALAAEGNTKTPKFLAWFYSQGETDALNRGSRLHYRESLRGLKAAIRNTIKGLGYSPYSDDAEMPWVQAKVMHVPYELKGTYPYYSDPNYNFTGDGESLVNNAILEENAGDEFGEWIYTDDLPRLNTDPGHLNGVGECARGARSSKRMAELVDHALGYGSPCLTSQDEMVRLYNRALALIGEAPDIQSLSDGSEQVRLCKLFGTECRDTLLQMRQWSFALRRVALTEVHMPQQPLYTQWGHCYVMPPEALNAFRVLPPDVIETPPTEAELISWAVDPAYAYTSAFVAAWDETLALNTSIDTGTVDASELPLVDEDSLEPQPYQVERSPHGGRYIFANQRQATLQYVERVSDATEWSPAFSEAFCAYLGSKLAGAIIKGREGERVAAGMLQKSAGYVRVASSTEAIQRKPKHGPFDFIPDHLKNR